MFVCDSEQVIKSMSDKGNYQIFNNQAVKFFYSQNVASL